jgi:hypothetical protein
MTNNLPELQRIRRERREDVRTWGAGHGGRMGTPSPMYGTRSGGMPQPSIVVPAPIGETITVEQQQQTFLADPSPVVWQQRKQTLVGAGFVNFAPPTDTLTIPLYGYWRLDVAFTWESWVRGGRVQVKVDGTTVWQTLSTFGSRYVRTFALGILKAGQEVQVWLSPDGTVAGSSPDGQTAVELSASLVLVDKPRGVASDPPVSGPTVLTSGSADRVSTSNPLPVPLPAMLEGDLLLVCFTGYSAMPSWQAANRTLTVPAGFTERFASHFGYPLRVRHWIGSRVATAADAAGTSAHQFSWDGTYNGAHATTVVLRGPTTVGTVVANTGLAALGASPRVVTAEGPSVLFGLSSFHDGSGLTTEPSSRTLVGTAVQVSANANSRYGGAHRIGALTDGESGGISWTASGREDYHAVSAVAVEVS